MFPKNIKVLLPALLLFGLCPQDLAATARLTVQMDRPGITVSPTLYGIFFEDINRGGEGGLYGEMIQNRSFEDNAQLPLGWTVVGSGGMELDRSLPLNVHNPTSLKLTATTLAGGRAGIASEGYKGVPEMPRNDVSRWLPAFQSAMQKPDNGLVVRQGAPYNLSFYARTNTGAAAAITASLERQDGTVLASKTFRGLGASWTKFAAPLTPSATETNARLVLSVSQPGTFWFDMVSLFPQHTFKDRPNGLRADLAQRLADMHPAFVRFPGGSFAEGYTLSESFRWKDTIGDVASRVPQWNIWGYTSSGGLGFQEYLQFCEDIGAEPLFVVNAGMAEKDMAPVDQIQPFVQDALDAVEYANGPVTSPWGALRAKNGHPAPFHLRYLEIGNENGLSYSWGGGNKPQYQDRYKPFYTQLKAKYPYLNIIADVQTDAPTEIVDEHNYNSADWFTGQARRFDTYNRQGPKIYEGEYADTHDAGGGNLRAALAEAAFMTGMERNSDIVTMSSYAPLFVNPSWKQWGPDAIIFDSARSYCTPSYYAQAMFAENRADVVLPVTSDAPAGPVPGVGGMVGVGTWGTQAEFKDIQVVHNGTTLFQSDFSQGLGPWKTSRGAWQIVDGALRQTGSDNDARAIVGSNDWKDYTLTLKARKLGGTEGFLILFQNPGDDSKTWLNLGGWGNTGFGLEAPGVPTTHTPGTIQTNRWYDIRVEVNGPAIKCYLDGQLIENVSRAQSEALIAVAGRRATTGETILKVVNVTPEPYDTAITVEGVHGLLPIGHALMMTSASPTDENSFDAPTKVAPQSAVFPTHGTGFRYTFPANSVTILRVKMLK